MIKTPLKLKRDTLSVLSTIDRTVPIPNRNSIVQLSRVVPAFVSTGAKPIQKSQYEASRPIMLDSVKINTNEIDRQMECIIKEEKTLSKRNRGLAKGSHFYNLKPVQSKIALGQLSKIPQKVQQIYDKMSSDSLQKVQFKQGILCNAAIYYFAIGSIVLFYDIGSAIKYGGQLQNYYSHQVKFQDSIYQIKQINWKHPIFRDFKNRNIVLISSPCKISFAALELQSYQPGTECSRWMRVTILSTKMETSTRMAYNLTESENYIYYLDESGRVNRLSIERNDWISKLIDGSINKYRLFQVSKPIGISSKSLYVNSRASFLERLRHYSKVIYAQTTSFYSTKIKNYDLICDSRRKLLFSLVDTNFNGLDDSVSNYKMLTCWDTSGSQMIKKCQISQLQLYDKHVQPVVNYNNPHNYRIAKIQSLDFNFDVECNLMIILHCGMRLYIRMDNKFHLVHYHLPPLIENTVSIDKNHQAKQHHKPVELTHSYFHCNTAIFNLKEQNDNHTIFIWKLDEKKECENGIEIVWGTNMNKGAVGNVPIQNYISKLNISFNNSKKQQIIKSLFPNSSYSPITYVHQLAKDLFYYSDVFVHSTDQQIQYFTVLRSVDKMFNAVLSDVKDEHILCKIFEEYSIVDVQYLLIQIFCDIEGYYLKDLNLIDCMTYFQKKCLKSGGTDFDRFQVQFYDSFKKASIKFQNRREIYPSLIGREVITPEIQNRILQLLFKLAMKRENAQQGKASSQIYQSICKSMLTYIARLFKFIWKKNLSELNKNISIIIPMVQPLNRIVQYFCSPQVASKINHHQQKQTKFVKSLIERAKAKDEFKIDGYKQHPLKMISTYINKIIQLIALCERVDLKLDRTFAEGLSLEGQNYQQYIFRFLIDQYEDPIKSLYIYKQLFPYFIGQNLEKAVKIFQQAKTKSKSEVLTILKFHNKVPSYLLAFYQRSSILHPEQIRQIKNNSVGSKGQRQLINCSSDKDSIDYYLKQLKQPHKSIPERNILILALSSMLNHYLIKHEQRQDKFYKQKKGQLQIIQKKVSFQQLIIEQYQLRSQSTNNHIVNQLKNTLYDEQMLHQFQSILKSYKISLIYLILFDRIDNLKVWTDVEFYFYNIVGFSIKDQQEESNGLITKAKNFIKSKLAKTSKSKWHTLEQDLKCITSRTHLYLSTQQLTQLFTSGILKIYSNLTDQMFQNHIISIISIFCNYKNKEAICHQATQVNLPVASLILLKVGIQQSELYRYYETWLRKYGEKDVRIKPQEKNSILYNWINIFCISLQVQPRWQFFLFNIKSLKQNYSSSFHADKNIIEQLDQLCQKFAEINNMSQLYCDIFGK